MGQRWDTGGKGWDTGEMVWGGGGRMCSICSVLRMTGEWGPGGSNGGALERSAETFSDNR